MMRHNKKDDEIELRGMIQEEALEILRTYHGTLDVPPEEAWRRITNAVKRDQLPDRIEEEIDLVAFHALEALLKLGED